VRSRTIKPHPLPAEDPADACAGSHRASRAHGMIEGMHFDPVRHLQEANAEFLAVNILTQTVPLN